MKIPNISGLSDHDLRQLRAKIDFLLGGKVDSSENNDHMEVLSVLVTVCQERGLDQRSVKTMLRSPGYKAFCEKIPGVLKDFPSELSKGERRSLLKIGLNLMLDRMLSWGMEVNANVMMNHIHRLPSTYELSFPGYLRSGIIRLVINTGG